MNIHTHARSCFASRALLAQRVRCGWTVTSAAAALGISRQTAYKWLARDKAHGKAGLVDRSSRPNEMPTRLPIDWEKQIVELRHHRMTAAEIARRLKLPRSTVARLLQRRGLGRLRSLEPKEPVRRYEWPNPGDMVHMDVKKLGRIHGVGHRITGDRTSRARGIGWEYVHVCIDDRSRLSYAEVLDDEKSPTAAAFLRRALAWFRRKGIVVRRVMTDNGSAYVSYLFAQLCTELALRHIRTRPYTPKTNGKAERFIQTLLREWAYVIPYASSARRTGELPRWLRYYNSERPHGSLGGRPPITRLRAAL